MIAAADSLLDTNILVYAASRLPEDAPKQECAIRLLDEARFGLSGQILQEFFVTVTTKISKPISALDALEWIDRLAEFPFVPIDADLVRAGIQLSGRYRISYWDAAVMAAAERLGATTVYTEDLNDGQLYGATRAINPFRDH
jgi:predicted nucleic acid-binding protein